MLCNCHNVLHLIIACVTGIDIKKKDKKKRKKEKENDKDESEMEVTLGTLVTEACNSCLASTCAGPSEFGLISSSTDSFPPSCQRSASFFKKHKDYNLNN